MTLSSIVPVFEATPSTEAEISSDQKGLILLSGITNENPRRANPSLGIR